MVFECNVTVKRYMRDPVKNFFWSIENSGDILDNLKLEVEMQPVCLLMTFLLFTLL